MKIQSTTGIVHEFKRVWNDFPFKVRAICGSEISPLPEDVKEDDTLITCKKCLNKIERDNMGKLYIVCPTGKRDGLYMLVSGGGMILATHICSNVSYAYGDLIESRESVKAEVKKRRGKYAGCTEMGRYPVEYIEKQGDAWDTLRVLNSSRAALMMPHTNEKELAGITFTFSED